MITIGSGDLLAADTDAVVNTVNCVGVMGKGIALQFKRRYPEMFTSYQAACKAGDVQIGHMTTFSTGEIVGPQWVVNFPTKKHWRSPSKLEWIEAGLVDLRRTITELGITSIAIPPLGAGNGGLDWADVRPLIESALQDLPGVEVRLYAPSVGRRTVAAGRRPLNMTPARALLLSLVEQYVALRRTVDPTASSGASHLEIQKLLYFATVVAPNPRMKFEPGRYGPYSDAGRHMLADMEGQFVEGFGDGDDRVLALRPISVTTQGHDRTVAFLDDPSSDAVSRTVDRVMEIVDGFESPYGVELLATTHWVATEQGATTPSSATDAVRAWSERKGRIFTEPHVTAALTHLSNVLPDVTVTQTTSV